MYLTVNFQYIFFNSFAIFEFFRLILNLTSRSTNSTANRINRRLISYFVYSNSFVLHEYNTVHSCYYRFVKYARNLEIF